MRAIALLLALCVASACQRSPAPSPPPDAGEPPLPPVAIAPSSVASAPPSAAPPPAPLPPDEARRRAKRATDCLQDPRCRLEEAVRLHTEAVDAGAIHAGCFDFYYGIVVPADAARARACFERKVAAEKPCNGASPSIERTFLGLMLLDAQGGPRERERGKALFADCLTEGALVIAAAAQREQSGQAKPIDFCADVSGTTLEQNDCAMIADDRADFEAQKAAKEVFATLGVDDAGYKLWSQAQRAWERFTASDAAYARDQWRGGTGAPVVYNLTLVAHTRERPEALRALLTPSPDPDAPREVEKALRSAEASAGKRGDAANRKLLAEAQGDWLAYRTAEVAFVSRAFAARYGGADAAANAALVALTRRRADALGKAD
ncbi:MAG: lysozyme inhibitor LprI family protein [Minicystis sp.]